MRKFALAPLLALSIVATAEKPKPNPADYPIHVQVVTSRTEQHDFPIQRLQVSIDSTAMEIYSDPSGLLGVLKPGIYPARIVAPSKSALKFQRSSDVYTTYELLLPDGSTRKYHLDCLGPGCSLDTTQH